MSTLGKKFRVGVRKKKSNCITKSNTVHLPICHFTPRIIRIYLLRNSVTTAVGVIDFFYTKYDVLLQSDVIRTC